MFARKNNRGHLVIREVKVKPSPFGYAEASVLYEQGGTKIYACVGLQPGVPKFMKGTGTGWLTAEYVMHPYASEKTRTNREFFPNGRDFRSIEISRIISRAFRSAVTLKQLGERTIFVDCDVLQADGSTRTACINAVSLALQEAEKIWLTQKRVFAPFLKTPLLAVSAGMVGGQMLLDLDKDEDTQCVADFNFIMTPQAKIVEVQGTAEAHPISWQDFDACRQAAIEGVNQLVTILGFEQK